jgi:hypothetical protein
VVQGEFQVHAQKLRVLVVGSQDNEKWVRAALPGSDVRLFSSRIESIDQEQQLLQVAAHFLKAGWIKWFLAWVLQTGNDKYLRVVVLDDWIVRDTGREVHTIAAKLGKRLRNFPRLLILLSRRPEDQLQESIEAGIALVYDTHQPQEHFTHLVEAFSRLLKTQRTATLWILLCWLTTVIFFFIAPPVLHYAELWIGDIYAAQCVNKEARWDVEVFPRRPRFGENLPEGYKWYEFRLVLSNLGTYPIQGFEFTVNGDAHIMGLPEEFKPIVRDAAEVPFLVGFRQNQMPKSRPSISVTGPGRHRPEVHPLLDPARHFALE